MESSFTAPASASAMASGKPAPKDLSHYLSLTAAARKPSAMKQYYKYFQIPGIGNLSGGEFQSSLAETTGGCLIDTYPRRLATCPRLVPLGC